MATKDQVQRIDYFTVTIDDQPGRAATIQNGLANEGVHVIGALAFPVEGGRCQMDLVPEHADRLERAAKKLGISLGGPKPAFLVQGTERSGAMGEVLERLGNARINVRASLAVSCGGHRYGGILWVAPADVEAAGRALGATTLAEHHV